MLDALSFALYGKPFRKITKGQLSNSINRRDLLVELEFTIGDRSYMVRRGMKPNLFELYVDGDLVNQDSSLADQQDYLERYVLRMNHRACMQVVILGSASFVPFMELPASHRREFLEDILDVKVITDMAALLKPALARVQETSRELEKSEAILSERLAMNEKLLAAQRESIEERLAYHRSNVAEIDDRIKVLLDAGSATFAEIEELEKKVDATLADRMSGAMRRSAGHRARLLELTKRRSLVVVGKCSRCEQDVPHEHSTAVEKRIDAEIAEVEKSLAESSADESELAELERRDSEIRGAIEEKRSRLREVKREVEMMRRSRDSELATMKMVESDSRTAALDPASILEEMARVGEARAAADVEAKALGLVAQSLRDDGAKAKILDQYVPVINQLINKYLADLDFFVEFELDSEFNESIKSRHRQDFSYHSFSEGEKMRIDLAILFAWRAVAKRRNSASTNVVIMDEIFDSSLDPVGAEELMKLISKLTSDTGVIIISHRGDQIADKFDRVLRFEKNSNFSRMVAS